MQIHAYQRTALQTVRLDNGTGTLGRVFRLENATANLGTQLGRLELRDCCLSIPRNTKNVTKTPSTPSCMPWTCIHSLLRWSLGSCYLIWAWCDFDAILMHLPLSCNPGAQGSICGGGHTTRCKVYHLSRTGQFFTNRVSMVTCLLHHADICVRLRNRQEAFRSSSPIYNI